MKTTLLSLLLLTSISSFAGPLSTCEQDEYSAKRIQDISLEREKTLTLTDEKGEQVGALFVDDEGNAADMILCGLYTNYFYADLNVSDLIPEMYEFKQVATVESATIYQDEALMSAFAYTDEDMTISDSEQKIQISFQYVNLADYSVESGQFYIVVEN